MGFERRDSSTSNRPVWAQQVEEIFRVIELQDQDRKKLCIDVEGAIKKDEDIALVGAPGALRTGIVLEATKNIAGLMVRLDGARAMSEKLFIKTLLEDSLQNALSFVLGETRKSPNKKASTAKEDRIHQILADSDQLLRELKSVEGRENLWRFYKKTVQFFLESCNILNEERTILVIERIREMRRWDKGLELVEDNRLNRYFYETYIRDQAKRNGLVSYIVLDVSMDACIDVSTKGFYREDDCRYFLLPPLSDEAVKDWTCLFLDKKRLDFKSKERDDCLSYIYEATEGHSGHVSNLLHQLYLIASISRKRVICLDDVKTAVEELTKSQAALAEAVLQGLSANQWRLLSALAKNPTDSVFAKQYIDEHGLTARSSLMAALKALQSQGLIAQHHTTKVWSPTLPMLASWLTEPQDMLGDRAQLKEKAVKALQEFREERRLQGV